MLRNCLNKLHRLDVVLGCSPPPKLYLVFPEFQDDHHILPVRLTRLQCVHCTSTKGLQDVSMSESLTNVLPTSHVAQVGGSTRLLSS